MSVDPLRDPILRTQPAIKMAALAAERPQDLLVLDADLEEMSRIRVDLAIALVAEDKAFLRVEHH